MYATDAGPGLLGALPGTHPRHSMRADYPATVVGNQGFLCAGGTAPIQEWLGWTYRKAPGTSPDLSPVFVTEAGRPVLESELETTDRVWLQGSGMFQTCSVNWAPSLEFMIPVGRPSYWDIDFWTGSLQQALYNATPPDIFVPVRLRGFIVANKSIALTGLNVNGTGWQTGEPWPCTRDVREWREQAGPAPGPEPIEEDFAGWALVSINRDGVYWVQPEAGGSWQILEGEELVLAAFAEEGIEPPNVVRGYVRGVSTIPVWAQEQGNTDYRTFVLDSLEVESVGFPEPEPDPDPEGNGEGDGEGEPGGNGEPGDPGDIPGDPGPPTGEPGTIPTDPGGGEGTPGGEGPTSAMDETLLLAGAGLLIFLFARKRKK